jgi:hypothetical protein
VELLHPNEVPYLPVPEDIGYREEPSLRTYHLTPSNLDFFLRLRVGSGRANPSSQQRYDDDITACIARLASAPGRSTLFAVSFYNGSAVVHRFLLQTTWFTREIMELEQCDFEISSTYWDVIRGYPTTHWAKLMNEIMVGSTDRAVLHRRRNLGSNDDFGNAAIYTDWQDFSIDWDSLSLTPAHQLVANHLCYTYDDPEHGERYAPMVTLCDFSDGDILDVRLPCGHRKTISIGSLKAMSPADCRNARCDDESCMKCVLTAQDGHLIELDLDREHRAVWYFEQIDWERLDGPVVNDSFKVQLTADILYDSLNLARKAMQAPRSATPRIMDYTCFMESHAISKHLRKALQPGNVSITLTPAAFKEKLQHEALKALEEASAYGKTKWFPLTIPPGYGDFLELWLTRTANHATGIDLVDTKVEDTLAKIMDNLGKVGLVDKEDKEQSTEEILRTVMGKFEKVHMEHETDEGEQDGSLL